MSFRRSKIREKTRKDDYSIKDVDRSFLTLLVALLLFGVVMIYNATGVYSQGTFGGAYRFALLQASWLAIGLLGFYVFFKLNLDSLRRLSLPLFGVALLFLIVLSLASIFTKCESSGFIFAPCVNGAHRWLYVNPPPLPQIPLLGVLGFQPSEFAKLALIIYLGVMLDKIIRNKESPFIVSLPVLFTLGVGFILSSDYRRTRLLTFLNPGASGDLSIGYHIRQIQIALGSGGLWGLGFGQSRQKFQYLPEVAADSIFAIIGEELGFIGTTVFILIFSFFIYKGFMLARNSPTLLGRLLATGITTWVAAQFFVNVAAMTRLIPLTGVPLPLVSYGGSSLVFSLMGLGLLANISARSS